VADYTPVALPGQSYTFTASNTIFGGDAVEITGPNAVGRIATAASVKYIGVAGHDAVNGVKVTVIMQGPMHESVAEGTVTAGDQLVSSSVGGRHVKTLAAIAVDVGASPTQGSINTAINGSVASLRAIVGVAITTGADNTLIRWVSQK
jgi:hypothetical protein